MAKKKATTTNTCVKTLRLRLKDKHANWLCKIAVNVNFVWNYVNDLSCKILEKERKWATSYDLDKYTANATKEGLELHSQTVQAISAEYVIRRK